MSVVPFENWLLLVEVVILWPSFFMCLGFEEVDVQFWEGLLREAGMSRCVRYLISFSCYLRVMA